MSNNKVTNLTELAYCFGCAIQSQKQRVTGVPSLRSGETIEQAIQRRAENAKRIEAQLAEKRAKRGELVELVAA